MAERQKNPLTLTPGFRISPPQEEGDELSVLLSGIEALVRARETLPKDVPLDITLRRTKAATNNCKDPARLVWEVCWTWTTWVPEASPTTKVHRGNLCHQNETPIGALRDTLTNLLRCHVLADERRSNEDCERQVALYGACNIAQRLQLPIDPSVLHHTSRSPVENKS